MTTATFGEVAKFMKTNVEKIKRNDKVCQICDAIQLVALMILPLLLPVFLIYGQIGDF